MLVGQGRLGTGSVFVKLELLITHLRGDRES